MERSKPDPGKVFVRFRFSVMTAGLALQSTAYIHLAFVQGFMSDYFQFEADFIDSLRCIPMQVRFKLDTCGIKLKLAQWNQFSQADRQALVDRACGNRAEVQDYRLFLQQLVQDRTGMVATELAVESNPAWLDGTVVPANVQDRAQALGYVISLAQWANLKPLQRFALIKLSRSSHESNNFAPALQEFHLV